LPWEPPNEGDRGSVREEGTDVSPVFIMAAAPALRAGLRAMLESQGLEVDGDAATIPEALPEHTVVVADTLPDDLPQSHPLVLLSDNDRDAAALQALGAAGWALLPRSASAAQLALAVNAAAEGLAVVPAGAASFAAAIQLSEPLPEPLTPRELEVLQLVSQGLSNKLIARALIISEHTVKFHVSSTYAKLGAASRTEAVSLAARRGLISL
jgi:DNA-binding NarL/FixJ family response regulator